MGADRLDALGLMPFQRETATYAHRALFARRQRRFLIADEVGLGKTVVARGVVALAQNRANDRNVIYVASNAAIARQNVNKLLVGSMEMAPKGKSLCLLAFEAEQLRGRVFGLTPTKDLRVGHAGTFAERAAVFSLLRSRHRSLAADSQVQNLFCGGIHGKPAQRRRRLDQLARQFSVPRTLKDMFFRHVDNRLKEFAAHHGIEATVPGLLEYARTGPKSAGRNVLGLLRAALAECAIEVLKPRLVILDEFQRYDDLFLDSDTTSTARSPQADALLRRRLLLLTATPYRPGVVGESTNHDPHVHFLTLARFLGGGDYEQEVQRGLAEVRRHLQGRPLAIEEVRRATGELSAVLTRSMARTERPREAAIERSTRICELQPRDLTGLRQLMALLNRPVADPVGRRGPREAEMVELWKSVPNTLSFLSKYRYVSGARLAAAVDGRPGLIRSPAAITAGQVKGATPYEPSNPRLRALVEDLADDIHEPLWLQPSLPYVRPQRAGASKTLVFTSWGAAPPAIAASLNVVAGMSRRRSASLLELGQSSTELLAEPLWPLCEASLRGGQLAADPLIIVGASDGAVDPERLRDEAESRLREAGAIRLGERSTQDADRVRRILEAFGGSQPQASRLDRGGRRLVAEVAVAAPGTCALRALSRTFSNLGRDHAHDAARSIGDSLVRLLGRPRSVEIIQRDVRLAAPHWRRALRYCLRYDLQSMLDEYVPLLAAEARASLPSGSDAHHALKVAELLRDALATTGRIHLERPPLQGGRHSTSFARSFLETSVDDERGDAGAGGSQRIQRRGLNRNLVLDAFNSPFAPFVLATTSTGQEGLDFHRYCRKLVHWNLPRSPLDMEQREGRVDRYMSLGVRSAIADRFGLTVHDGSVAPWDRLLREAEAVGADAGVLAPRWHFGISRPIKAIAFNIPFSREEWIWERLQTEAALYRIVLGQADPQTLLEALMDTVELTHDLEEALKAAAPDLRPRP